MFESFARRSFVKLFLFYPPHPFLIMTKKASRRKTREYLLQALYSRSNLGSSFDQGAFLESFYDEAFQDSVDTPYFEAMFDGIVEKEGILLAVIEKFAPKFDIAIMPIGNLLPIMIAGYEMLYLTIDQIPEKVSIDEAIELSKTFSDAGARTMVNGVLNALKNEKETIRTELEKDEHKAHFFA